MLRHHSIEYTAHLTLDIDMHTSEAVHGGMYDWPGGWECCSCFGESSDKPFNGNDTDTCTCCHTRCGRCPSFIWDHSYNSLKQAPNSAAGVPTATKRDNRTKARSQPETSDDDRVINPNSRRRKRKGNTTNTKRASRTNSESEWEIDTLSDTPTKTAQAAQTKRQSLKRFDSHPEIQGITDEDEIKRIRRLLCNREATRRMRNREHKRM